MDSSEAGVQEAFAAVASRPDPASAGDCRVVVIGSGPAGAMAAMVLTQNGIPVTLLESGSRFPGGLLIRAMGRTLLRRRVAWKPGAIVAGPGEIWYQSLVPGGLSNNWTGAVPRFSPDDFTDGARLDERYLWPVTYEELAPYYERVERVLGVTGQQGDAPGMPGSHVRWKVRLPRDWRRVGRQAASAGQGLIPMPLADGAPWMVSRSATGFNSFTNMVEPLLATPGFELILGAHALRLEWDPARRQVKGVLYHDRASSTTRMLRCRAVVVAAGTLASTKLLQDSANSDFPSGLGDTEGLLGHYLDDHGHDWVVMQLSNPLRRLRHPAYLTREPHAVSPPLLGAGCTLGARLSSRDRVLNYLPLDTDRFGVVILGAMVPTSQNTAGPHAHEKDEFGLPALQVSLRFTPQVASCTARAVDRLLGILNDAGCRATIAAHEPALVPGSSVHYGGTARMHSSPKYGVTDGWSRMHAVPNVVVADASTFTTGVEKNPTLTVMALAARAADRLSTEIRTS